MDQRTFATLELQSLLDLLAGHVQTPLGRRLAEALRPSVARAEIELAQDFTTECARYLSAGERFGLAGVEDPEAPLAKLQIEGTTLEPLQILQLERLISVGMGLREQFRDAKVRELYPQLSGLSGRIPDLRRLLGSIKGKILPGGEIDDNASPELRAVRRELGEARARIFRSLDSILKTQTRAVQEDLVTFRNGRFVIPIRTDSRNQVPGVVHGLSSSGQTTFVEPLAAIEQNNGLVRLREQEEIEISRILLSISEALRVHLPAIAVVRDDRGLGGPRPGERTAFRRVPLRAAAACRRQDAAPRGRAPCPARTRAARIRGGRCPDNPRTRRIPPGGRHQRTERRR